MSICAKTNMGSSFKPFVCGKVLYILPRSLTLSCKVFLILLHESDKIWCISWDFEAMVTNES